MRIHFVIVASALLGCSGSSDDEPTTTADAATETSTPADASATDSVTDDSATDSASTDTAMVMTDAMGTGEYVSGSVNGTPVNITNVLVTTFSSATLFTFSAREGTAGMAGYKFINFSVTNAVGTYDCKTGKAQIAYATHEAGDADARSTRGTCSVTVTKAMAAKGDAIEATFTADMQATTDGPVVHKWTDGKIRVVWR